MSDSINLEPIKQKLEGKGSIFVLFGSHATVDHVAASLGLFLVLKEAGHDVSIASPAELRAEFSRLVGLNEIGKTIGNRNLVIAFTDYDPGSIEKISHNDGQENHFELIIQPKSGAKAPDPKNIEYSFRGAQADLIFLVGVTRLEDLGALYESERKLYSDATTVSFNRRQNPSFAAISVVDSQASSLSEMVAEFIDKLEFKITGDTASNLLAGIDYATNRFQNPVISATAFLTAGKLIQNGARRQPPRITSASQMAGIGAPVFAPFAKPPQSLDQPGNQTPPPFLPELKVPDQGNGNQANPQPNQPKPPKDWLEPKIYKGGSRV